MLHVDLILEDTRIVARRDDTPETLGKWSVVITDQLTGIAAPLVWTDTQIAAVAALAFGIGEDTVPDAELTAKLYAIAEPAIVGLPTECRPIP